MIREFLSWWFGQLSELLPQGLRRSAVTAVDAMVIKPIGPLGRGIEAVSVGLRRNGRETPLGRFGLGATNLAELPRATGRATVLRLGEQDVLGKTVTLPLAAERELDQVLGFEMDRETPFKAEEIYWNRRIERTDRQNGRLSVRLVLVPKVNLAPLLTALGQSGIPDPGEPRSPTVPTPDSPAGSRGMGVARITPRTGSCGPRPVCWMAPGLLATPFIRQEFAGSLSRNRLRPVASPPPRPITCTRKLIAASKQRGLCRE